MYSNGNGTREAMTYRIQSTLNTVGKAAHLALTHFQFKINPSAQKVLEDQKHLSSLNNSPRYTTTLSHTNSELFSVPARPLSSLCH